MAEWLKFITDIAWPLVALIALLFFRHPLRQLLLTISDKLESFEMEWDSEQKQLKMGILKSSKENKSNTPKVSQAEPPASPFHFKQTEILSDKPQHSRTKFARQSLQELTVSDDGDLEIKKPISESFYRIRSEWEEVEEIIDDLILIKSNKDPKNMKSAENKINFLAQESIIDTPEYNTVIGLRRMYILAANNRDKVTREQANDFVVLANSIKYLLITIIDNKKK